MHLFGGSGGSVGGLVYYHRDVYPDITWDYEIASFPTVGALTDFDISAIVPSTAKLVHLHFLVSRTVSGGHSGFSPKSWANSWGYLEAAFQSANRDVHVTGFVPIDSSGIIRYYRQSNVATFNMLILGWLYQA